MPSFVRRLLLLGLLTTPALLHADDSVESLHKLGGVLEKRGDQSEPAAIRFKSPLDDAGLSAAVVQMRKLPELTSLDLGKSTVTAAGLKELHSMKQLRALKLETGRDGDSICEALLGCKSLESLDLSNSGVTDDGLGKLAALPNLNSLTLRNSPDVHGRGFKAFADGKMLEIVDLTDSRPTATGMRYLAQIPSLKALYLQGTRVGDAGLMQLAGHKKLMSIDLSSTYVTDDGVLPFICMFRKFSMLDVRNTRVSRDVAARIEKLGKVADLRFNR